MRLSDPAAASRRSRERIPLARPRSALLAPIRAREALSPSEQARRERELRLKTQQRYRRAREGAPGGTGARGAPSGGFEATLGGRAASLSALHPRDRARAAGRDVSQSSRCERQAAERERRAQERAERQRRVRERRERARERAREREETRLRRRKAGERHAAPPPPQEPALSTVVAGHALLDGGGGGGGGGGGADGLIMAVPNVAMPMPARPQSATGPALRAWTTRDVRRQRHRREEEWRQQRKSRARPRTAGAVRASPMRAPSLATLAAPSLDLGSPTSPSPTSAPLSSSSSSSALPPAAVAALDALFAHYTDGRARPLDLGRLRALLADAGVSASAAQLRALALESDVDLAQPLTLQDMCALLERLGSALALAEEGLGEGGLQALARTALVPLAERLRFGRLGVGGLVRPSSARVVAAGEGEGVGVVVGGGVAGEGGGEVTWGVVEGW